MNENYTDCLGLCQKLIDSARIEFVGTAAYYPILPLLPRPAIERQVLLDVSRHRETFANWKTLGFVPPEMAFGPELLPILKQIGYEWCCVDDTTYVCLNGAPPFDYVPYCAEEKVLLRSSLWSRMLVSCARNAGSGKQLALEMIKGAQSWMGDRDGYLFLALDPECFGHHRSGSLEVLYSFLQTVLSSKNARLLTPGRLVASFPSKDDEVPPGSWRTTSDKFWEGEFFAPWQSRYNNAHSYLWDLTDLAVGAVAKLQQRLDRSLHAGFYWWEENSERGVPESASKGLQTLIDVIAAAAPEDLERALELTARLDELT